MAKVGDISRVGRSSSNVLDTADHYVDASDLLRLKAKVTPPGSVLFAKIGEAIRQNHRVLAGTSLLIDNNAMAAIPDISRVEPRYLFHFLRSVDFYPLASSTTVPALRKSELARLPVPLPAREEQRRIAAILDQADALRAKRRQALANLDRLAYATFRDSFGDPAANPSGLPISSLNDWIDPARPITYGILKPGPDIPGGTPYVRVADMQDRRIQLSNIRRTTTEIATEYKRSTLMPGDLLMSIRGHVGRFAFVPDELAGANITQDTARLAVTDPDAAVYVRAAMESPSLQHWMARRTKGAAVQGINLGDLRKLPLPVPPRGEMKRFAEVIRRVEVMKAAGSASLDADDKLFASLQSRAFAGDL